MKKLEYLLYPPQSLSDIENNLEVLASNIQDLSSISYPEYNSEEFDDINKDITDIEKQVSKNQDYIFSSFNTTVNTTNSITTELFDRAVATYIALQEIPDFSGNYTFPYSDWEKIDSQNFPIQVKKIFQSLPKNLIIDEITNYYHETKFKNGKVLPTLLNPKTWPHLNEKEFDIITHHIFRTILDNPNGIPPIEDFTYTKHLDNYFKGFSLDKNNYNSFIPLFIYSLEAYNADKSFLDTIIRKTNGLENVKINIEDLIENFSEHYSYKILGNTNKKVKPDTFDKAHSKLKIITSLWENITLFDKKTQEQLYIFQDMAIKNTKKDVFLGTQNRTTKQKEFINQLDSLNASLMATLLDNGMPQTTTKTNLRM